MNMRLRMRLDLPLACRHTSQLILRCAAGNQFLYGLVGLLLGLVGLAAMPRLSAADAGALPTVMDQDPPVVLTDTEAVFSAKLKPLWIEALRQPDSDLQRQAAETIARAHLQGMPKLSDCGPTLIEVLEGSDQHPAVQLACARALVQLEAEAAAAPLFEVAKRGSLDLALLVEPALGRWKFAPIRELWFQQLQLRNGPPRRLKLAATGLALSGDPRAIEPIKQRLIDSMQQFGDAASSRLALARALAELQTDGLEETARRFAENKDPAFTVDRIVASQLLRHHQGSVASTLLSELATDRSSAVACLALERLTEIDPQGAIEPGWQALDSPDAKLRTLGIRSIVLQADQAVVTRLAAMMNDYHVEVRTRARTALLELATEKAVLDPLVRDAAEAMLGTDYWRGQEQSILLLVALDHKRTAGRLVQLLDFRRPAAYVTAAWGLRELRVPTALPAMLRKADRVLRRGTTATMPPGGSVDKQCCYLMEAFGLMEYQESESLLWRCVPKNYDLGVETRAAAIWSLGKLSVGRQNDKLAIAMAERLSDVEGLYPEIDRVRFMSAITMGRLQYAESSDEMGAKAQALEALGKYFNPHVHSPLDFSCGWSLARIKNRPFERLQPRKVYQVGWFLEPLEP